MSLLDVMCYCEDDSWGDEGCATLEDVEVECLVSLEDEALVRPLSKLGGLCIGDPDAQSIGVVSSTARLIVGGRVLDIIVIVLVWRNARKDILKEKERNTFDSQF